MRDRETVACAAGATTTEVILCPHHRADLKAKLVTNAVNIAMEVSWGRHIELFRTGVRMRGNWSLLAVGNAIRTVRRYFVDATFIVVNGIDDDCGFTCVNDDEAVFNSTMAQQARRRIVVADHSKLSAVVTHLISPIEAVDTSIIESGASDADVAPNREF